MGFWLLCGIRLVCLVVDLVFFSLWLFYKSDS